MSLKQNIKTHYGNEQGEKLGTICKKSNHDLKILLNIPAECLFLRVSCAFIA